MSRSISRNEFDLLRREVRILIITAMGVERDTVNKILKPVTKGVIPIYNGVYRFGYLGEFLVAHRMCGQAGLNSGITVSEVLSEFRIDGDTNSFFVLMPGICCGLRRSHKDKTTINRSELEKYFIPNRDYELPSDIANKVTETLKDTSQKILLPLYLTPETTNKETKQFMGDILVATSIKQHNFIATKPDKIEDRGNTYDVQSGRVDFLLEHAKTWRQNSPEAKYGKRLCQVHAGQIISGDELLNHFTRREELRLKYKDAIGLEMEGHGLAASVSSYTNREREGKAFCLLAKAIVDWGVGKSDSWQEKAATASVSLFQHCLNDPNFFSDLIKPTDPNKIKGIFIQSEQPTESLANPQQPLR